MGNCSSKLSNYNQPSFRKLSKSFIDYICTIWYLMNSSCYEIYVDDLSYSSQNDEPVLLTTKVRGENRFYLEYYSSNLSISKRWRSKLS